MFKRILRAIALLTAAVMLLTSCSAEKKTSGNGQDSSALTWCTFGAFNRTPEFSALLKETYPEVELEFISRLGANGTGYSWAQMRADDIPDIFITSQILDEELAKERLADLSGYSFIDGLSTSVLDQSSIDGGIYLLPISYSMSGIIYNKTLMEEKGWEVPANFAELEALCGEIKAEGLIPGIISTKLTGGPFSAVFNLAKTDWLTTPDGVIWEKNFLGGTDTAKGRWESTMDYVQRYVDIGMFNTDPEDKDGDALLDEYIGGRKAVFYTAVQTLKQNTVYADGGDELGIMPYIGEDGSKNVYMYNASCYFGISKRLTEPGNEEKLKNALKVLSLIYSKEGQDIIVGDNYVTMMGIGKEAGNSANSILSDAQQALHEGRAFPMTYVHWDGVLADMGQAYKDWFRGEEGADGNYCIAKMDELQSDYLNGTAHNNFCESTADFTREQTAELIGKALGSAAGTDAVMLPIGAYHNGNEIKSGINCKLYAGQINSDVCMTICPVFDGEYAVMTMTGSQAKAVAAAGFDSDGNGDPYKYLLVVRGGGELEDNTEYKVAFLMNGYTDETAQTYSAEIVTGSLRGILHSYLEEQKTVSPDGNPWE